MDYHRENKKLYPLKAGDILECVESDGIDFFKKGLDYLAVGSGIVLDGDGDAWFQRADDVPYSALFKLKPRTSQWVEGPPPEEVPEDKQVVLGYKLVEKPTLEVGKVYTDGKGQVWKAVYDTGEGIMMMLQYARSAICWSYTGKPYWASVSSDHSIDFSVPPQDDY